MPIYEYICQKCSHEFECLVNRPNQRVKCPACKSGKIEKQFSLFGMGGGSDKKSSDSGSSCTSCRSGSCKHCSH